MVLKVFRIYIESTISENELDVLSQLDTGFLGESHVQGNYNRVQWSKTVKRFKDVKR